GITAFIEDDAGFILPALDANIAAIEIIQLANSRDLLIKAGAIARARVVEKYTSEIQCLNIYKAIEQHSSYTASVSVAVPFYNHENFVPERIESILSQTIKDIEIILLDDASKDRTTEIASTYLADPRVQIITNSINSGS